MKTKNTKILRKLTFPLLFSVILIAFLLFSCGEKDGKDKTGETGLKDEVAETATEAGETRIYPDLPERDFGGYQFNILHWVVDLWGFNDNMDIYAEELDGDAFNDAVFYRNKKIEETYNVKISLVYDDIFVMPKTVQNMVKSGDNSYDLIFQRMANIPSIVMGGYLHNLNNVDYIDFSKPWWDKNSINELSVDHKSFLAASDIQTMDKDAIYCVMFNKQEAQNYDLGNLYALVESGDWTLDKLYDLCKDKSRDLNGNGTLDKEDFIAFVGADDVTTAFFNGGGGKFAEKDEDDIPYLTFYSPRNLDMCDKILDFMYDKNVFRNGHYEDTADMFPNGNGLFVIGRLADVRKWRYSETDFGILPIPKFDKAQERYYSTVSVHTAGLLSIPTTAPDIERTGIIAEAWAAESRYTVIPAYYDIALKGKYTRDEESKDILDLLMVTRLYDLGEVYAFGGFNGTWLRFVTTKGKDIVSAYEKAEKMMTKDMEKLIKTFEDID